MAQRQPPQQPPPAQWLRLQYAKTGSMRFSSHRDFSRVLERALRRARVPMAYSSGFNPHPRISYVGAAPTGASSDAEYFEIGVATPCEPDIVVTALNDQLPAGFRIVKARVADGIKLANRLEASQWVMRIADASAEAVATTVKEFMAAEVVEITRQSKKIERVLNVRADVVALTADENKIRATIRHAEPTVRPDELFSVLGRFSDALGNHMAAHRVAQGWLLDDGRVADPLEARPAA